MRGWSGCSGCCAFCLSCDACSFRCVLIGSISVSSWRCCVFVSIVQPVMVRSAAFCTVCSLLMLVSEAIGDQMVFAYSSVGRVMDLYVACSVSFDFPQCVDVSALSIFVLFFPVCVVFCMCFVYVSFGSSVSPSIFGSFTVGRMVLLICRLSVVLYCAGSGVNSVVVVLSALSVSWFVCVQSCICCR